MTGTDAMNDQNLKLDHTHGPEPRWLILLEYAAVFGVGFLVLARCLGGLAHDGGLPGNDSFYHLKMATLLPEFGLLAEFPWLRYAYFMRESDAFVSHHYGFHALLLLFVRFASWLGYDDMAGARLAMATCMGTSFALTLGIVRTLRIPYRGFWLLLLLLLPYHFYQRHAYVRAIGPSFVMILTIVLLLLRHRPVFAGLALGAFIHVYLGGVIFGPVVVICYACACLLTLDGSRHFPVRTVAWCIGGWIAGIATFPYRRGMLEFLELQLFGTGLSPDIPVGREWRSYEGVWWFSAGFAGTIHLVLAVALILRLRDGRRLDAPAFMLLLLKTVFFVLTLKARRFVEYWPVFALLSAATLCAPVLRDWHDQGRAWLSRQPVQAKTVVSSFLLTACLLFAVWWGRVINLPVSWGEVLIFSLLAFPGVVRFLHGFLATRQRNAAWAAVLPTCLLLLVAVPVLRASHVTLTRSREALRCKYDLDAVACVMDEAKKLSKNGDVIFTDDWDIFPVFFYFNSKNHYIVGLDPKFTHARRPDLWTRFVKITQGKVPCSESVSGSNSGSDEKAEISIRLQDIRDVFGAHLVITDNDHKKMARRLAGDRSLVEEHDYVANDDERENVYRLWKVKPPVGDETSLQSEVP
ncbi:MAG: hypothetical protein ACPGXK_09925 [Phycisphaerae bacterium]